MRIRIILFIFVIASLTSCISFKFKGKRSPKTFYSEFFIDNGVMQYFIKPLEFNNKKEKFLIDFTFRDTANLNSYITTNYSIFSEEVVKSIDSAYFIFENNKIYLQNCERLFIDNKKLFQIRYTCKIKYNELILLSSNNFILHAYYNNSEHVFFSTKRTQKGFYVTKHNIIDLIELNRTN